MSSTKSEVVRSGITFGTALAMVISYDHNHSVLWAVFHGITSWFYVLYHLFFH